MHRRTFLLLATAATAGCTASDTTDPTTTTGRSTTRTTTTTSPPTTTGTTTTASTEPTSKTETPTTETTETTSTTTTEDTPTPKERAAAHLSTADDHIGTAVTNYAEAAGTMNVTILTVNAATTNFNRSSISSPLSKASTELDTAAQYATDGQQDTLAQYRTVIDFLTKASLAQKYLIDARKQLQAAATAFYESDISTLNSRSKQAQKYRSTARDAVGQLQKDTTAASMAVTSHISKQQYTEKLSQFDTEISTLKALDTRFGECVEALVPFKKGVQNTLDGNDVTAWTDYWTAAVEFSKIETAVTEMTPAESLGEMYSTLKCFVTAMAKGAAHMRDSANAGRNDDSSTKTAEKQAAKEDFKSCDESWTLDSVQRLFDDS